MLCIRILLINLFDMVDIVFDERKWKKILWTLFLSTQKRIKFSDFSQANCNQKKLEYNVLFSLWKWYKKFNDDLLCDITYKQSIQAKNFLHKSRNSSQKNPSRLLLMTQCHKIFNDNFYDPICFSSMLKWILSRDASKKS